MRTIIHFRLSKKMKTVFLSFSLFLLTVLAFAKPVAENTAKLIGANFLNQTIYSQSTARLALAYKSVSATDGTVYFYVFSTD